MKHIITIFLFLLCFAYVKAQSSISVKLNTETYQLSDAQPDIIKMKLSDDGKIALEPGLIFSYDAYATPNAALHISQSFILDKASRLAGASSIMLKFRIMKYYKHSLYASFGPAIHYRQTWENIAGYKPESIYKSGSDWQYKFSWISGEIEYNYYINKMNDFSLSLIHIQAESIGLAIGFKHWISKKQRKKRGCISCPGIH